MTPWRRLKYLLPWRRRAMDADIREELDSLAAMAGPGELGNLALAAEDARAEWGWLWLERFSQDLRYGSRMLTKNPAFTFAAIVSLAIGIGANCAMFSFADGLLLRPLPVPRPEEVVTVTGTLPKQPAYRQLDSYRDYVDLRDWSKSFEGLIAYTSLSAAFSSRPGTPPVVRDGMMVTGNFFRVLGVKPELGREFAAEEDRVPGGDAVVILGHNYWKQEFGSDRAVLGKGIRINNIEFKIIGVAPAWFTDLASGFNDPPAFYLPMMMAPRVQNDSRYLELRDYRTLVMKGRLKAGVSLGQARAEVATIAAALRKQYPETNRDRSIAVRTEMEHRLKRSPGKWVLPVILMMIGGGVLVVACANVAGLLSSQAPVRARELTMRLAIGAGRPRLIRQLLTEALLLGVAGGLAGLGIGYVPILLSQRIQLPGVTDAKPFILDHRALAYSMAAMLLSVAVFGLLPAIQTTRLDLINSLRTSSGITPRRRRFFFSRMWSRNLLVMGQVAISLVLFSIGSAAYIRVRGVVKAGPGFRADHALMIHFNPALIHYDESRERLFYQQLMVRVRSIPGVKSATLCSGLDGVTVLPEGHGQDGGEDDEPLSALWVDVDFFRALGLPVLRGRTFRDTDSANSSRVAVVTENIADEYWPGQNPLGKRFRLNDTKGPWLEVVGVAKPNNFLDIGLSPNDYVYLPYAQKPVQKGMILFARSAGDPMGLVGPVREVVRSLDPNQPMYDAETVEGAYDSAMKWLHVFVGTISAMGLTGMMLALVGLYGLVSYDVNSRTREIGVRMALGADRRSVLRMVLRQGFLLTVSGVGAGVVLVFAALQLVDPMLPGPDHTPDSYDITYGPYAVLVLTVLAVTMLAAYVPARRAARVDPSVALRFE